MNEKCDLTADMALRLSRFTQTTPEMWLNLQLAIELWDAYHTHQMLKKLNKFNLMPQCI